MVRETKIENKVFYACEECGFRYERKEIAEQCQAWCKEHNSCNLEITSQGMPPEEFL